MQSHIAVGLRLLPIVLKKAFCSRGKQREEEMNGSEWNKSFREPASHSQESQERGRVLSSCTLGGGGAGDHVGVPIRGLCSKEQPHTPPGQSGEQPGSEDEVESRGWGRTAELEEGEVGGSRPLCSM